MSIHDAKKKLAKLDSEITKDAVTQTKKDLKKRRVIRLLIIILVGCASIVLLIFIDDIYEALFPDRQYSSSAPHEIYVSNMERDSEGVTTIYLGINDPYYDQDPSMQHKVYPFKYNVIRVMDKSKGYQRDYILEYAKPADGSPPIIVVRDQYIDGIEEGAVNLAFLVIGISATSNEAVLKELKFD